jgi:hypothetical protein
MQLNDAIEIKVIKLTFLRAVVCFFFLCALLSACAAWNKPDVIKQGELMPMAPSIGPSRRVVQQLTVQWSGRKETFLCVLELDKQRIAMAGLTNDGFSLFNLTYDGKRIVSDKSPLLPDSVAPESIITDLQLVYWPATVLKKNLYGSPWRLEFDTSHRQLYYQGNKTVEVNYLLPDAVWAKSVELVNHSHNYRLLINTISYENLSE